VLGVYDDTALIRQKLEQFQPDVILNLIERFKDNAAFDQNIAAFLELLGVPFTGCGALGLSLCKNKGLSKEILSHHRIRVPNFIILPVGKKVVRPKRMAFPLFIKPLKEEASYGISQASFVESDEQFQQRVAFIHEKFQQDAIAEEYIDGRELYVSVLGNGRLQVFPIREIVFKEVPPDEPKFASYRVKWDEDYRERWGIANQFATGLDDATVTRIEKLCKKIYRLLHITGYARLDLRLTATGEVVFIEANPNPILSREEDFAESAVQGGLPYAKLIERIIRLAKPANGE
jgi:D-alanine-D-alanine ligase